MRFFANVMTRPRLLYIFPDLSSFVRKDLSYLESEYEVVKNEFRVPQKALLPWVLFKQFVSFPFISFRVKKVVAQFGGYHTMIPAFWCAVLNKKLIIVLGGFDAVALPEIGYGAFANKWMRKAITFSYRNADLLLPVHESLILSANSYTKSSSLGQGVKHFIPSLKTRHTTIFNGYKSDAWQMNTALTKAKTAMTIAVGLHEERRRILKGVDLILETAPLLPDWTFTIIGDKSESFLHLVENIPNVKLFPALPQSELEKHLQTSQVYLQLSLSEGFPNALCEAMLCGCIPVVSDVASMPEIVANTGFILKEKSSKKLSEVMESIPNNHSVEAQVAARNRIANNFTESSRKEQFLKAIREI